LVAGALAELLLLQPLLGQEIGQSTRFRRMVNMLADAGSRLSQPAPTARGLTTAGEVHDTPPPSDGELRQAALDALEFIEPYVDVVDGDYGEPAPNRAMTIASNLRNALGDTQ